MIRAKEVQKSMQDEIDSQEKRMAQLEVDIKESENRANDNQKEANNAENTIKTLSESIKNLQQQLVKNEEKRGLEKLKTQA